ncbi:unnamed protein product [Notodromas monacha]|uniref:Hexosyltransferase n=1 Tax=Notodromas monacha TaxID=399045 RepID=A0A7R9BK27_9CRUS|nr:unnamed protein product [Notodromas monacha]CAG0916930.1 unnamed protein product [Notodromas monacha]
MRFRKKTAVSSFFLGLFILVSLGVLRHVSKNPREYKKLLVDLGGAICAIPGFRVNDFSFLLNPNFTQNDGKTVTNFKKCREICIPGYIINNPHKCDNVTEVIVAVVSAPRNELERKTIRETWGRHLESISNSSVIFAFGKTSPENQRILRSEADTFGDLIQFQVEDRNFGIHTCKQLLVNDWIRDFCPGVAHILATDDDLYVNARHLVDFSRQNRGLRNAMLGYTSPQSMCRDKTQDLDDFPTYKYPYPVNARFIIQSVFYSRETALRLSRAADTANFWRMASDMYISGVLAEIAGIERKTNMRFAYLFGEYVLRNNFSDEFVRVAYKNAIVISHLSILMSPGAVHITPAMIYKIHGIFYPELTLDESPHMN